MSCALGVLISGGGSNLQAIIERIEQGALQADLRLVVSNRPDAYGLQRAAAHSIPSVVLQQEAFISREEHERAVAEALEQAGVEAVALAGYMRLVSGDFIERFNGRVLNIHPALLPSFKGLEAQKQAVEYGVRIAGATVHFVDQELDHGPIIIQAAVPAPQGCSGPELAERILQLEHRIYPQALQWQAAGRLEVRGGQTHLHGRLEEADTSSIEPCLINPCLETGF